MICGKRGNHNKKLPKSEFPHL